MPSSGQCDPSNHILHPERSLFRPIGSIPWGRKNVKPGAYLHGYMSINAEIDDIRLRPPTPLDLGYMNIFTKADRVPACDVSNENEADPLRTSLMIQWLFAPHLEVDLCAKSGIDLTSKCRWCRLAVGWLVWFLPTPFLHSEVLLTSATYRAPLSMLSTVMCGARCSLGLATGRVWVQYQEICPTRGFRS